MPGFDPAADDERACRSLATAPPPRPDAGPEILGPPLVLPPGVDDASALIAPIRREHGLPALGAAVWKDGKLIAIGMTGLREAFALKIERPLT